SHNGIICALSFFVSLFCFLFFFFFFFFTAPAPSVIYTLSLHDALPICLPPPPLRRLSCSRKYRISACALRRSAVSDSIRFSSKRSEEHTSELQSLRHLVCRLLLEKKKKKNKHKKT